MASHRLAKINIDDLDIMGYSVAGEETVVAVPQLDCCFDIGKSPDQVISINHVLLTHGHMDHAAGIAYYLSHRNFDGQAPGTILAPENLIPPIKQILEGWASLDGSPIPATLVGVSPGDEYTLKPNLIARAFPTHHCHGSVGFTILERRRKLKPEYLSLNGPQIVTLKTQGVDIDYPLDIPLVTYLGDTSNADFSKLDYVADSKILITECTFYEDDHTDRARAGRHLHVHDFIDMIDSLNNEHVIITHTTQRTSISQIKHILKQTMPPHLYEKTTLLMDRQHLSP